MSKQFPNQYWDVYKPSADCKAEYQGKKLFADPDRTIPDDVLQNFTLEKEKELFLMTDPLLRDYQRVALHGYVFAPLDVFPT